MRRNGRITKADYEAAQANLERHFGYLLTTGTPRAPKRYQVADLRQHRRVREFAELLTQRRGENLAAWMRDVDARGAAPLRSFTKGLRTDLAAVTAGLTLPDSSAAVEGAVTRIKALKRQMYGRAGFSLLRKRILNPA